MAQLVEHIVHIDGVTGSSPVATTGKALDFQGFFFFPRGKYPNRTPTAFLYMLCCTVLYEKARFLFWLIVIVGVFAPGNCFLIYPAVFNRIPFGQRAS